MFVASECHVNETFRLHFHNGQQLCNGFIQSGVCFLLSLMVMFDVYKLGLQLYKKCAHKDLIVTNCNFKWVTIKLIILCAKSVTKTHWVSSNIKLSVVDIKKLANRVHSLQIGTDTVIPISGNSSS